MTRAQSKVKQVPTRFKQGLVYRIIQVQYRQSKCTQVYRHTRQWGKSTMAMDKTGLQIYNKKLKKKGVKICNSKAWQRFLQLQKLKGRCRTNLKIHEMLTMPCIIWTELDSLEESWRSNLPEEIEKHQIK